MGQYLQHFNLEVMNTFEQRRQEMEQDNQPKPPELVSRVVADGITYVTWRLT